MPFKQNLRADIVRVARNAAAGALALAAMAAAATDVACAKDQAWITTWAASPQPTWQGDFPLPTFLPFNLWNQTVRQKVRVSLGGDHLRIVLSNEYGKAPLAIDSVHIALPGADAASIDPATDHVVTFSGAQKLSIPGGAPAVSDPIDLKLAARGDLVVTFLVAGPMPIDTFHWDAEATSYIGAGDQVANATIGQPTKTMTRIFLSDVLVEAAPGAKAVVAFGDSITDGASSGVDQNARWPDFLAENLAPHGVAVCMQGRDFHTFVMVGDGELQEGQVWEAALFGAHQRLGRLICIIDRNGYQLDGAVDDVVGVEPILDKWRAFGWEAHDVDGHDVAALATLLRRLKADTSRQVPAVVLAQTVKGKGVSYMETEPGWHLGYLDPSDAKRAIAEIKAMEI